MSTLYMVATPIGNLDDITIRALNILKSVDVIACEDTRHTSLLLSHYDIKKRTIACHAHNEEASSKGIISLLDQGQSVAYCSDAGTPGISDPGARLCENVRNAGHDIVPLPGASAVVTLLSCAGNVGKTFTFEGFLSPKKGRRTKRLTQLLEREETFIFYESPFRIVKTLKEIEELMPNARITMGRELTKAFEEIKVDSVSNIIKLLESRDSIKGEFAVAVTPGMVSDDDKSEED